MMLEKRILNFKKFKVHCILKMKLCDRMMINSQKKKLVKLKWVNTVLRRKNI